MHHISADHKLYNVHALSSTLRYAMRNGNLDPTQIYFIIHFPFHIRPSSQVPIEKYTFAIAISDMRWEPKPNRSIIHDLFPHHVRPYRIPL